jgi:hypothetical protein
VSESLGSGNVIPIEAQTATTLKQQQQQVHANAARVAVMYMQLKETRLQHDARVGGVRGT